MSTDIALLDEAVERVTNPTIARGLRREVQERLEGDWESWVHFLFPEYVLAPFAAHHRTLWEWLWRIEADRHQDPFVAIWARGAAKSTTAELGVAALAARRRRTYCLYVSGTEDLANKHVANVAGLLESPRFGALYPRFSNPAIGKFGNSKGWRRNRLSTAGGFTIDAVGLDQAIRGVRIDADRPDLIVLDDVDDTRDSPKVTQGKVDQISRSVLPTGAEHCIVLGVQNLVLPNGVFARIAGVAETGSNDLLSSARVSGPIPAVRDLRLAQVPEPDDETQLRWKIIEGTPTWDGQSLERCEIQIGEWGKSAFLIEAQHEVQLREGGFFKAFEWMEKRWVDGPMPIADHVRRMRAWDTAGTEPTGDNNPDWTVGVLVALDTNRKEYRIEDVRRFRHASGTVRNLVRAVAMEDVERFGVMGVTFGVEEEPGHHGRDAAYAWVHETLAGLDVKRIPASGTKEFRAEGLATAMENQLISIVGASWTNTFLEELQAFPLGDHDDQVDAAVHAFNWLRRWLLGGPTTSAVAQQAAHRFDT